jgi:hypothetical protein
MSDLAKYGLLFNIVVHGGEVQGSQINEIQMLSHLVSPNMETTREIAYERHVGINCIDVGD